MKTARIFALALALVGLALASAACNKAGKSPTGTAKAFYDAVKSKDAAGMKNAMSKKSVQMMEQVAKMQNKSLDDWLKERSEQDPPTGSFETRNEKINGDMGTLEVNDGKGKWDTIHFVKEDGLWKMDLAMTAQGSGSGGGAEGGGAAGGGAAGGGEHGGH